MFGSKADKAERLARAAAVIGDRGEITAGELARRLGVPRSTVARDLASAEARGMLLCEDGRGRISLFERWFGRRGG